MTREDINKLALTKIDHTKCLILELTTGFGKTKIAIDLINHICNKINNPSILLIVAKTVHKETWRKEINKWGGINYNNIKIECYESLKRYTNSTFDIIVLDEVHHLSINRANILNTIHIKQALIGLSATIKKETKEYFQRKYNASFIKYSLKEAIENDILPEPKVYLIPLDLNKTRPTYKIEKFGHPVITTQRGCYNILSTMVDWYKDKYYRTGNNRLKLLWLSTAGKRLKWLSEQKEYFVLQLLHKLKDYRTLTFCSSINQSENLGKYNITSKNKASTDNLNAFNEKKIKHITACSILNEGVNLTDCRIGIFCSINSSDILIKQKNGRLLRHHSPIIIIPYYKNTREEELVTKMTEEYHEDSIVTINNIHDIKL